MSPLTSTDLPGQSQVNAKLAAARWQIGALERAGSTNGGGVAAESCACAAVDQMLQALSVALHGLNRLMPDPLPPSRVSWRNLRDRFFAVEADSQALRAVQSASRAEGGWLRSLELKREGSAYAELLNPAIDRSGPPGLRRDPLRPELGDEPGEAVVYLAEAVEHIDGLIRQIAALAPEDVARYREGLARQTRRMM